MAHVIIPKPKNLLSYVPAGYAWAGEPPPIPATLDPRVDPTPFSAALIDQLMRPDGARLIASSGGLGCGKSYGMAQAAKVIAMDRPGAAILMSASSAGLLKSVMKKRFDDVLDGAAVWHGSAEYPHYRFPNGSFIDFRAYHCKATTEESDNSLEGRDYHATFIDETEQLPHLIMKHALERTRISWRSQRGRLYEPSIVWNGRPGVVDFWVNDVLAKARSGERAKVMLPRTWDNPTLWEWRDGEPYSVYINRLRGSLPEAEFNCKTGQIPGSEMPVDGAIYGDFSTALYPKGNILKYKYRRGTPVWVAIDFGGNWPSALFIAREKIRVNGRFVEVPVIFDELQPNLTLTGELLELIAERTQEEGYTLEGVVCDPAGNQVNAHTGITDIQLTRKMLGVPVLTTTNPEKTRILKGIEKTRGLILNANKERFLYVSADLWEKARAAPKEQRTIRDLLRYAWGPDGLPIKGARGGQSDHVADALRYYVILRHWRGLEVEEGAFFQRSDIAPAPARQSMARRALSSDKDSHGFRGFKSGFQ